MERVNVGVRASGREATLKIIGMHCATCSITVQRALQSVRGVKYANVSLASDEARLVVDDDVDYPGLLKAVREAGYDIYAEELAVQLRDLDVEDERVISRGLKMLGVFSVGVNVAAKTVHVTYNPLDVDPDTIVKRLREMGYEPLGVVRGEVETDVDRRAAERELTDIRRRVLVALPAAAVLMALMPIWFAGGIDPLTYGLLGLALATPAQFYSGMRFIRGAVRALRNGTANMDTLVTLGTLSAYTYSVAVLAGLLPGETFFEASAAVIGFVLLGRYLEARMRIRAGDAVKRLLELQPKVARVLVDGREVETPTDQLEPGTKVSIRQGERVPADGIVDSGRGYVDESAITGEPEPREKGPGDLVVAGTFLVRGHLVVRVTRTGRHTLLAQIARLVRQAQASRLPIQSLVDRISGVFTWIVIGVAALTFAGWLYMGVPLSRAIMHMASVLVVACPCALGLATPLSIVTGVGRSAEKGILVRNPEALERLKRVDVMAFDKTGTLTVGRPRVVEVVGGREVLEAAAIAEAKSEHPLAMAILERARELGIQVAEPETFDSIPGAGVVATVNGTTIAVGNEEIVRGMGAEVPGEYAERAGELRSMGYTSLYVVVDGQVVGLIAVGDEVRPESFKVVEWLRSRGVRTAMLTGDNEVTAKAVAARLNMDQVYAGLKPDDKAKIIKGLREEGHHVAMVGDGINDAPALSSADVGIAVGTGTEIAKESGDVVLTGGSIDKVIDLYLLAEKILRNVRFNLFWAFIYNIVLIPLAAGVFYPIYLRPEMAGAAMALSSISVTLNSLRLRRA